MKNDLSIFDISELQNKVKLMEISVDTLSRTPSMAIVVAHLISTFIDSLAATLKVSFEDYLELNFPDLCNSIGADMFRTHIPNKAVHEFAIKRPLALAHATAFDVVNSYSEVFGEGDQKLTYFNIDRLTKDFLECLEKIKN